MEHLDVIVVGAGLSGIGAGCHLTRRSPWATYAVLEARAAIGGTWDLFRYPGVRSDSDMYTFGFGFRPWTAPKDIAPGGDILDYLSQTAADYGVDKKIRFHHRIDRADWHSETSRWIVSGTNLSTGEPFEISCHFLLGCTGYYDYAEGYLPDFKGIKSFGGTLVHPQKWPGDLDVSGKRVLVIGSGATAVTLVPTLAQTAAHVTMLQRSPTYVFSRPGSDNLARVLRRFLPAMAAHHLVRLRNVFLGAYFYTISRRKPDKVKRYLINLVQQAVGPDVDAKRHFAPSYAPWDQRLCLVPDGDLFEALRSGRASVVTDQIEGFTNSGVTLASGPEIAADIVVTATGLKLKFLGGMEMRVDGRPINSGDLVRYKGAMFGNVPNFAAVFGYTNASWTLKADLTLEYVCKLINRMRAKGNRRAMPVVSPDMALDDSLPLQSGYFRRAVDLLPKQGKFAPWNTPTHYPADYWAMKTGRVDDGVMQFD